MSPWINLDGNLAGVVCSPLTDFFVLKVLLLCCHRVDSMHCGHCYEDSMTESLWCDHSKEMRADVSTSPEFSLSRGGEEDIRRKDSHIATFQPSRENQALAHHIPWTTFKSNPEGFHVPHAQEPASPFQAPEPHPSMSMLCDWQVPSSEALTCSAHVSPEYTREKTQMPKMIMFF